MVKGDIGRGLGHGAFVGWLDVDFPLFFQPDPGLNPFYCMAFIVQFPFVLPFIWISGTDWLKNINQRHSY